MYILFYDIYVLLIEYFKLENVDKKVHFRHIFFYEYRKGNNTASAFKNICTTYGEGSLSERTCRKWFIIENVRQSIS